MFALNASVRAWTDDLRSQGAFRAEDVVELETHLREEIDGLVKVGLSEEEAFLVAERRVGMPGMLAREFARKKGGTPWRGLAVEPQTEGDRKSLRRELLIVTLLALGATGLAQLPHLFGATFFGREAPIV